MTKVYAKMNDWLLAKPEKLACIRRYNNKRTFRAARNILPGAPWSIRRLQHESCPFPTQRDSRSRSSYLNSRSSDGGLDQVKGQSERNVSASDIIIVNLGREHVVAGYQIADVRNRNREFVQASGVPVTRIIQGERFCVCCFGHS